MANGIVDSKKRTVVHGDCAAPRKCCICCIQLVNRALSSGGIGAQRTSPLIVKQNGMVRPPPTKEIPISDVLKAILYLPGSDRSTQELSACQPCAGILAQVYKSHLVLKRALSVTSAFQALLNKVKHIITLEQSRKGVGTPTKITPAAHLVSISGAKRSRLRLKKKSAPAEDGQSKELPPAQDAEKSGLEPIIANAETNYDHAYLAKAQHSPCSLASNDDIADDSIVGVLSSSSEPVCPTPEINLGYRGPPKRPAYVPPRREPVKHLPVGESEEPRVTAKGRKYVKYTFPPCPHCGRILKSRMKGALDTHIAVKHKYTSDIVCHICGKPFQSRKEMSSHAKTHRNAAERLEADGPRQMTICSQCGKSIGITSLTAHLLTHLDPTERKLRCTEKGCEFTCVTGNTLRKHMSRAHDEKHEKRFKCPKCDEGFQFYTSLKGHLMTTCEALERPHACRYCDRRFRFKQALLTHYCGGVHKLDAKTSRNLVYPKLKNRPVPHWVGIQSSFFVKQRLLAKKETEAL